MPPTYVNAPIPLANAGAGVNLLAPNDVMIRPKIGGRRRTKKRRACKSRKQRKQRKQSGGFLPSIGEPFVAAVSKYIAPLALFGIYRFIQGGKKTRRARK
jgi:hypothetical protein